MLQERFGLHNLAVEDSMSPMQGPKVEEFHQALLDTDGFTGNAVLLLDEHLALLAVACDRAERPSRGLER
jgi:hypothetical protein